ncbi:hypothetical protein Taro_010942 [Colocasia esculenta]|uniref:Uncharacterized protein n=1 Tax=Colocasia esculenta TaxID=4460 RepID=A0A843U8V6_COLES|nr:hypothetical protein [Colocasia esculenta]
MEARPDLKFAGLPREASAAERPHVRVEDGAHDDDDDGAGSEEDFEFSVPGSCSSDGLEAVTADEIFADGLIRPVYPLFDRGLVFDGAGESSHRGGGGASSREKGKEKEPQPLHLRELMLGECRDPPPSSSSPWESNDVEGLPAEGSYCAWAPRSAPASPDLRRKSHSAGAGEASKRWRLFSLVMGRSHSDGQERLVFLQDRDDAGAGQQKKKPPAGGSLEAAEKKRREKGRGAGKTTEMDMVTAHRLFYARGGATAPGHGRRSFLPYRKDLLGFFGNVNVHGSFHP